MANNIYLDFNYILSLDALFTLVTGSRGVGKTYGFKKWAIADFKKTGSQFIYIRRYDTEFDKIATFFDDMHTAFPEDDFIVKNNKFYINNEIAGFYFPLSKAQQYKSMPFPLANKLLYDEYIIDDNLHHYIKDEINIFYNVCETVFRMRDFRAFLFANSTTLLNPYNIHFDCTHIPYGKNFIRNKDLDSVYVHLKNEVYENTKSSTRFGKAVKNTDYGKFAIQNVVKDDMNLSQIEPKTECYYFCTLKGLKNDLYFYMKNDNSKIYCSDKGSNENYRIYSIYGENLNENVIVTKNINTNYHLKTIKLSVVYGFLYFTSPKARAIFYNNYIQLFIR